MTKGRIRRGFPTIEAFRTHINSVISEDDDDAATGSDTKKSTFHPRWVRINAVKTTLDQALSSTFSDFTKVTSLKELSKSIKGVYIDEHIPNLIAIHPSADFSKHAAYRAGQLIFQDKASCFPAYLLDPKPTDGQVIDACAAPGNKTTHLAAIIAAQSSKGSKIKVTACERNPARAQILQKMVKLAGGDKLVTVKASQDFIRLKPNSDEFTNVGALLLDPSCSGSGIIGRDETAVLHLPSLPSELPAPPSSNRKRKRKAAAAPTSAPSPDTPVETEKNEEIFEETPEQKTDAEKLKTRLTNLAGFQLKILLHAFSFGSATKVTYSTCSVHAEENEQVVLKALASRVAKEMGWRVMRREEQVEGMKKWGRRGVPEALEGMDELLDEAGVDGEVLNDACIRCERGTDEGTMGFFVAAFVRDADGGGGPALNDPVGRAEDGEERGGEGDEWGGCSDDE